MRTAVLLSYKGLGANLLHLSYCHEIAKKFGPITIITLCKNLEQALSKDPLIEKVICLNNYHKKIFDILNLGKKIKDLNLINIFIFYPSIRFFIASKIAGIRNIYSYSFFSKKNLHLVNAAKKFTEINLDIRNCPTETEFHVDKVEREFAKKKVNFNKKNIVLGIGSSGPTTRWGSDNYINLIQKLNAKKDFFFYLLCGPDEKEIAQEIIEKIGLKDCISLSNKSILELIPTISLCDMYIGNDSFGHHITSQRSIPSLIILLDTPRAYTDYSKNQFRILPEGIDENLISHDSNFSPYSVTVNTVIKRALELLN